MYYSVYTINAILGKGTPMIDEGLYYCENCEEEIWVASFADEIRCPDCLEWSAFAVTVR